jgi:hypothetical protein
MEELRRERTRPRAADDFRMIRVRIEELRRERAQVSTEKRGGNGLGIETKIPRCPTGYRGRCPAFRGRANRPMNNVDGGYVWSKQSNTRSKPPLRGS